MGAHIVNGQFQSDKYPMCPPGKVPLSVKDATAQDLLWEYAQRRRAVDAEFSADLETALRTAGYVPKPPPYREISVCAECRGSHFVLRGPFGEIMGCPACLSYLCERCGEEIPIPHGICARCADERGP